MFDHSLAKKKKWGGFLICFQQNSSDLSEQTNAISFLCSHSFKGWTVLVLLMMMLLKVKCLIDHYRFSLFFINFLHSSSPGIIKCVTLTTLYMNSMWWPPNRSIGGQINQSIFLILSALSAFNYVMATLCGPGFLPLKWQPTVNYFWFYFIAK